MSAHVLPMLCSAAIKSLPIRATELPPDNQTTLGQCGKMSRRKMCFLIFSIFAASSKLYAQFGFICKVTPRSLCGLLNAAWQLARTQGRRVKSEVRRTVLRLACASPASRKLAGEVSCYKLAAFIKPPFWAVSITRNRKALHRQKQRKTASRLD